MVEHFFLVLDTQEVFPDGFFHASTYSKAENKHNSFGNSNRLPEKIISVDGFEYYINQDGTATLSVCQVFFYAQNRCSFQRRSMVFLLPCLIYFCSRRTTGRDI